MAVNVLDWLEQTARTCPDRTAFSETGGKALTFSALRERVITMGSALRARFPGEKRPGCVICGRNTDSIAAFLAVAYAGICYVPVDGSLPPERMSLFLAKADPAFVIDCAGVGPAENVLWLTPENLKADPVPRAEVSPDAPLYGIFTSGSTGIPKLVMKSHRAMISFIECYTRLFGFRKQEILANQIPFYFDASTKDIFTVLSVGCTCVIFEKALFAQPGKLAEALTAHRITSMVWVPSALLMLSRFNVFSKYPFPDLRRVQFVGEPMPPAQLRVWMNALPEVTFTNLYGATENAGNCLYYTLSRCPEGDRVPVGYAFPNVKVFLLSEEGTAIDPGETDREGEICIQGDTLALGYAGEEDRTAEKFVDLGGVRTYRTGDLGRYDGDGAILCIGRRDHQIKLQGCRIELSDIEAAAGTCAGVDRVCALFDEKKSRILLVYSGTAEQAELIGHLKARLPAYMLPGKYIYRPELPLNQNGKIHRTALKAEYII